MIGSLVAKLYKPKLILGILYVAVTAYSWISCYLELAELKEQLRKRKLFYEKHNCVVMYSPNAGARGWPGSAVQKKWPQSLEELCEPILYFIDTAEISLDIACMIINIDLLVNALIRAHKRGVRVRVLVDYAYNKNSKVRLLKKHGIETLYYVCPEPNVDSIMHYKYAVKDYSNYDGYAMFGSMNWTQTAVRNNYENLVFVTERTVVDEFHNNFVDIWATVKYLSENKRYVKYTLMGIPSIDQYDLIV